MRRKANPQIHSRPFGDFWAEAGWQVEAWERPSALGHPSFLLLIFIFWWQDLFLYFIFSDVTFMCFNFSHAKLTQAMH